MAVSSSLSPLPSSAHAADAAFASVAGHAVWRADPRAAAADAPGLPTGFAALDAELPGGGWPAAGLIDLLQPAPAGAELRLLAPLLGAIGEGAGGQARPAHDAGLPLRPIVCIAPPAEPCAPALAALRIALARIVWLHPTSAADAAWAAEQALRSTACGAVLWWSGWEPPRARADIDRNPALWRRLHLAAQAGASPLFALRPAALRSHASPAPLRLALTPAGAGHVDLLVFKRRGPPMAQPLRLALTWTTAAPFGALRDPLPDSPSDAPRDAPPAAPPDSTPARAPRSAVLALRRASSRPAGSTKPTEPAIEPTGAAALTIRPAASAPVSIAPSTSASIATSTSASITAPATTLAAAAAAAAVVADPVVQRAAATASPPADLPSGAAASKSAAAPRPLTAVA